MHAIIDFFLGITANLGHTGVFVLMTIESSFIPFPSEIVVPPAAFLAAQGEMNLILIIVLGTLGSLVGALINYYLAQHLGKPIVYKLLETKWAKYFFLNKEKMQQAEAYFRKHGKISTFVGRLIPGIRQLISIPAGFVKMPLGTFLLYTGLGAGIWVTILALLGYYFGANEELTHSIISNIGLIILAGAVLVIGGILIHKFFKKRN